MQLEILFSPSYAMAKVALGPGERVSVEAGSLVAMSAGVPIETRVASGGFFRTLARRLLGGESVFVNTFTGPGDVYFAPPLPGDIVARAIDPASPLLLQARSYLAHEGAIDLRPRWGGLRALVGGEGAFLLHASGKGRIWLNCHGGIRAMPVPPDGLIVDSGHVVAFDPFLEYRLETAGGGLISSVKTGEGLVFRFRGDGTVWIQSRTERGLADWIARFLPA